MADPNRRTVFSTDPDPEPTPTPRARAVPQNQQTVRVAIERKGRGGKTVSVITGVVAAPAELEKLCKQVKNSLGAGGSVKGPVIEIQGDQREAVARLLTNAGFRPVFAGG